MARATGSRRHQPPGASPKRVASLRSRTLSGAIPIAEAIADTRIPFHRCGWKTVLGAVDYLGFEALVLWEAFLAIHANRETPRYTAMLRPHAR